MMSGSSPMIVVMGVSASGKTVVAEALATRLDCAFLEGDDCHLAANVAKMRAGHPLTDADRAPWLARIADWIADHRATGGVVSCSALKRVYRDRLRQADPGAWFVLLDPPLTVLRDRIASRRDHFMPASLLDSQLATLERPADDEHAVTIADVAPVDRIAAHILHALPPVGG